MLTLTAGCLDVAKLNPPPPNNEWQCDDALFCEVEWSCTWPTCQCAEDPNDPAYIPPAECGDFIGNIDAYDLSTASGVYVCLPGDDTVDDAAHWCSDVWKHGALHDVKSADYVERHDLGYDLVTDGCLDAAVSQDDPVMISQGSCDEDATFFNGDEIAHDNTAHLLLMRGTTVIVDRDLTGWLHVHAEPGRPAQILEGHIVLPGTVTDGSVTYSSAELDVWHPISVGLDGNDHFTISGASFDASVVAGNSLGYYTLGLSNNLTGGIDFVHHKYWVDYNASNANNESVVFHVAGPLDSAQLGTRPHLRAQRVRSSGSHRPA